MPKHRGTPAVTATSVLLEVRVQMSDRQIIDAVKALTFGAAPYKANLVVAGRPVRLENRGDEARMGRFGGGWMTSVGVQMGSDGAAGTIIINLGHGSIRINPRVKR